ncbi:unnamed protein product [Eretmochelys imbricata]
MEAGTSFPHPAGSPSNALQVDPLPAVIRDPHQLHLPKQTGSPHGVGLPHPKRHGAGRVDCEPQRAAGEPDGGIRHPLRPGQDERAPGLHPPEDAPASGTALPHQPARDLQIQGLEDPVEGL